MFNCKKCKSNLNDSCRYCYNCGSYVGEPLQQSNEFHNTAINNEEIIKYDYNCDGKIVVVHCNKCNEIVKSSYNYCSNCGTSLVNNTTIKLIDPEALIPPSVAAESEHVKTLVSTKYKEKIISIFKFIFRSKKSTAVFSLILAFFVTAAFISIQYFKPKPAYEQDPSYRTFVQYKDWIYYSYFQDVKKDNGSSLQGIYKINVKGTERLKITDVPATFLNPYKKYIYYINISDRKIYRINQDGSNNKVISNNNVQSILVYGNYIYYRANEGGGTLYRMNLDGSDVKEITSDALSYNIIGSYIYYSSKTSAGYVYRIKADGTDKTKMCKIDGVLQYVKDDYIYYKQNTPSISSMFESGYLYRTKLDGSSTTKLSDIMAYSFFIDNSNEIYYIDSYPDSKLYKINLNTKVKTEVSNKVSLYFYTSKNKLYYLDLDNFTPYRIDLSDKKSITLVDVNERLIQNYKSDSYKKYMIFQDQVSDINFNKANKVIIINNKSTEIFNSELLEEFITAFNKKLPMNSRIIKYKDGDSPKNIEEITDLIYDGKEITYLIYKKDTNSTSYKVETVLFFQGIYQIQSQNSVKYYLTQKANDIQDKSFEFIDIPIQNIKR